MQSDLLRAARADSAAYTCEQKEQRTQRGDGQRLCLAAREQRAAVGARQEAPRPAADWPYLRHGPAKKMERTCQA